MPSLLTLALLISLSAVGALVYTPALPEMTHFFKTSPQVIQFTMTVYLVGYAVSQLFYGPISKYSGRKKGIYLGLFFGFLGSLLCALSAPFHSLALLMVARLIMAIGAASGYALTFTILNDAFPLEERRRVIPLVAIGLLILPYGSIVLGGVIVEFFSWDTVFYLFCLYAIILFFLARRLPETAPKIGLEPYRFSHTFKDYGKVLKSPQLWLFSAVTGCCIATFYIFSTVSPFIAMHTMGLKSSTFGFMNILPILGMVAGTFIARKLAKRFSGNVLIPLGLVIFLAFAVLMFLLFLLGFMSVWVLFIPMLCIFIGMQIIWSNSTALATQSIEDKSHGASMMSFLSIGLGMIGLFIVSASNITTPYVMPLIFIGINIAQWVFFFTAKKVSIP